MNRLRMVSTVVLCFTMGVAYALVVGNPMHSAQLQYLVFMAAFIGMCGAVTLAFSIGGEADRAAKAKG